MGKPRLSDLSEEDRLKLMRQVTRELNEAAQNARDAGRQLTAATGGLDTSVAKTVQAIVDAHMDQVNRHLEQAAADLLAQVQREEEKTRNHYAGLLGATSYEGLIKFIIDQVYDTILPEINRVLRTLPGDRTIQIGTRAKEDPAVVVMDSATFEARQAAGTLPGTDIRIDGP